MQHSPLKLALTALLMTSSSAALAIPFASFETRSMGMGGVGVAVGSPDAAPLFNPALLSVSKSEDDFSLILPTIGVGISDPTKLRDAVDSFQKTDTIGTLNTHISQLNAAVTPAQLQAASALIATDVTTLSNQLTTLSNRPIAVDGGAAAIASIPGKSLGLAFYADAHVATGGVFNYTDAATLTAPSTGLAALAASCGADPVVNAAACNTLKNFQTSSLTSGVHFKGVALGEMGISMSHLFEIGESSIALAVTPKVVKAQLFDAQIKVNDTNQNNVTGADYLAEYSFANFDIGAAKLYDGGWRTGIVVKNVIPQTLDFKRAPTAGATPVATGEQLNLKPQARIGVSHSTSWSTVAMDLDITRNDPAGFEQASQYLALGGELDAFGWLQLRAGYRMNLVDSARNVYSAGLGFALFGVVHADVAAMANADEIGASFQLGMHF